MLFPPEADYRAWFGRAGFADVEVSALAPGWYRGRSVYAVAVTGTRRGPTPLLPPAAGEQRDAPLTLAGRARFLGRFVIGAAAGFAFVPIGAALALRARLARR